MSPGTRREVGLVYTFYSYKGGVGRTMAVANVAALLAKWGRSVLVVDWDLEAPGIERFFFELNPDLRQERITTPGVADLISARAEGKDLDWRKCLLQAKVPDSPVPVSILSAGRDDKCYTRKVQSFNFERLFAEHGLGDYIEKLRQEWTSQFEFVLIDSRTGITDIGGICTIHLPDVLVLLFTTTNPSLDGALDVLERARAGQSKLPFSRARLIGVPIPAREESATAKEKWFEWKRIIAERCQEVYKDWLPVGVTASDALELLRIPYIPYWSFGEPLPAIEGGTIDPGDLGFRYEILARLIAADLAWKEVVPGTLPPERTKLERPSNEAWLDENRKRPKKCLQGRRGSMEFFFYSPNELFNLPLDRLLAVVRAAAVTNLHRWPLVTVSTSDDQKPRPANGGILADMDRFYWAASSQVDFYGVGSFPEDEQARFEGTFLLTNHALWVAEALLFSAQVFKAAGGNGNCQTRFNLRYGGLKGRSLSSAETWTSAFEGRRNEEVDEVTSEVRFSTGEVERDEGLAQLVRQLIDPVCLVFDFYRPKASFYSDIIDGARRQVR